jgi:hypothetical protein
MWRLGVSSYYFSCMCFYQVKSVLGSNLQLCLVEVDGKIVMGDQFAEICCVAQGLLSGK